MWGAGLNPECGDAARRHGIGQAADFDDGVPDDVVRVPVDDGDVDLLALRLRLLVGRRRRGLRRALGLVARTTPRDDDEHRRSQ